MKGIRLWKKEYGSDNMGEAVNSIMTQRNMYRRRYRTREWYFVYNDKKYKKDFRQIYKNDGFIYWLTNAYDFFNIICIFKYENHSINFLTICIFLLIPVQVSKKNRLYKVIGLLLSKLFFSYIQNIR